MARTRMRGERPLEINGEYWGWKPGKKNVLIIRPSGQQVVVPNEQLIIVDPMGRMSIKPGEVGRYIRANLIEGTDAASSDI